MRMKCPHCGISGRAASATGGRLVRCPRCTELFLLPEVEVIPQAMPSSDLFVADDVDLTSVPGEEEGQEDTDTRHETLEQEQSAPVEEEILVDASWLAEEFSDAAALAEPDTVLNLSEKDGLEDSDILADERELTEPVSSSESTDGLPDWNQDFDLETEPEQEVDVAGAEVDGSEELAFDETFGEELAESFEHQEITDGISGMAEGGGGLLAEESDETEKSSNFPDFSDNEVTWKEDQPELDPVASPQPSEEAIQEELDEMLATTCVACDNKVDDDELYCPDCMKKKEADRDVSVSVDDDSTAAAESAKQKNGSKKALLVRVGVMGVVLLGLIGFLLYQYDLI